MENVLTIYSQHMPVRILEEVRLWKMQEKEHTLVLLDVVTDLPPAFSSLVREWGVLFDNTQQSAHRWIESLLDQRAPAREDQLKPIHGLAHTAANQSEEWIGHLYRMIQQLPAITGQQANRKLAMHIVRDSEYFLGVMRTWLQTPEAWPEASARDESDAGQAASPAMQDLAGSIRVDNSHMSAPVPIGGHRLPPLPYAYDALEPYIDAETMRLHHDKHHQSYVNGLNQAELMMQEARNSGDFDLIKHWEKEAAFHGAGHYLHTIFWNIMSPEGGGPATGAIAKQIERDFGSFEAFKQHFSKAAEDVEGGGWAILVWSPRSHRLEILQAEKHQNLSQWDVIPLLVLDVWEHAYYLKHQNNRAAYIEDWWNTVNWRHVNDRFIDARRLKWTPY